jgi:Domain of Unknown Function (DUF928)
MRLIVALLMLVSTALAATAADQVPPTKPSAASGDHPSVVYRPPDRGAPEGRISAATRGVTRHLLRTLAPDHVGLTLREQPVLYWLTPEQLAAGVKLVIISDAEEQPLVDKSLPGPLEAGIHAIRLSELGVKLKPDLDYRWSVAPANAPRSISASFIRRVTRPGLLLQTGSSLRRAAQLADAGIWYDALDAASQAGADVRRGLLEQIGIKTTN